MLSFSLKDDFEMDFFFQLPDISLIKEKWVKTSQETSNFTVESSKQTYECCLVIFIYIL